MNQPSVQEFFTACGARSPLMLEIQRPDQPEIVRQTLPLPFAVVGRHERADLYLDHQQISRWHAYLQVVNGRALWVPLSSRADVQRKQRYLAAPLRRGQHLRIGPVIVRLAEGVPPEDDPAPLPNPLANESYHPSTLPRIGLNFLRVEHKSSRWVLDRVLTLVGRAALCGCIARWCHRSIAPCCRRPLGYG